jgi:hypothetical protein
MDEVHVKLYLQIAEAGYIPATSELNYGRQIVRGSIFGAITGSVPTK